MQSRESRGYVSCFMRSDMTFNRIDVDALQAVIGGVGGAYGDTPYNVMVGGKLTTIVPSVADIVNGANRLARDRAAAQKAYGL